MTGLHNVGKNLSDKEIVEKFILQQAVWTGAQMVPWIDGGEVSKDQITPNGIDLTADKVFKCMGNTILPTKEVRTS